MAMTRTKKIGLDTLPPEILSLIALHLQNDPETCIDMPFRVAEYDAEPIADAWREWQDLDRCYDLLNFTQTCQSIRRNTIHQLWQTINLARLFMVEFVHAFIQKFIKSNLRHPCMDGIVRTVTFSEYRVSPYPFWWQRRSHIKLGGYYRKLPIGLYEREKSRHQIAKVGCILDIHRLQELIGKIVIQTAAKQLILHKHVYLRDFEEAEWMRLCKAGVDVKRSTLK